MNFKILASLFLLISIQSFSVDWNNFFHLSNNPSSLPEAVETPNADPSLLFNQEDHFILALQELVAKGYEQAEKTQAQYPDTIKRVNDPFYYVTNPLKQSFVSPNETKLSPLQKILKNHPDSGIYLTVGSERAFISHSLCKNCTGLIVIDNDSVIGIYNWVVSIIIKGFQRPDEYRQFILESNESEWSSFFEGLSNELSEDKIQLLKDPLVFKWFSEIWKTEDIHDYFYHFFRPDYQNHFEKRYNYIFNEELYRKNYQMLHKNAFEILEQDIGDLDSLNKLVENLKKKGQKISVLDLSNLIDSSLYLSVEKIIEIVELFAPVSSENAKLIISIHDSSTKWEPEGIFNYNWHFFDFPIRALLNGENHKLFIKATALKQKSIYSAYGKGNSSYVDPKVMKRARKKILRNFSKSMNAKKSKAYCFNLFGFS